MSASSIGRLDYDSGKAMIKDFPPVEAEENTLEDDHVQSDERQSSTPSSLPDLASLMQSVLGGDPMSAVTQLLGGASGQTASSFEGVAGGDAVRVTMNGERRVTTIVISPEVLDGADAALLEDMILAAFNDAFEQVSASKSELLGGLAQLLSPR